MEALLEKLKEDIFSKMDENKDKLEEKMDSIKNEIQTMKGDINVNNKKIKALDVNADIDTIKHKVEQLEAANKDSKSKRTFGWGPHWYPVHIVPEGNVGM